MKQNTVIYVLWFFWLTIIFYYYLHFHKRIDGPLDTSEHLLSEFLFATYIEIFNVQPHEAKKILLEPFLCGMNIKFIIQNGVKVKGLLFMLCQKIKHLLGYQRKPWSMITQCKSLFWLNRAEFTIYRSIKID